MRASRAVVGSLAFVAMAALAACGSPSAQQAMPPTEVGALAVKAEALPLSLEYAAQLRGAREVEVRARVSGILLERRYEEGAPVSAGDLLFRIDPAPFRAEVARARAELAVQQATLRQATRERDRAVTLFEQRAASGTERDAALAGFDSARAAVAAAQAALRRAELDLSYTDVRAPIEGITSHEARSEGSLVTAGVESSLLTQIVQTDRLYVDFAMPEREAHNLRTALDAGRGQAVSVRLVDANGDEVEGAAQVEFVAPRVGTATGMVAVRATYDNRKAQLLPGQVVRARIAGLHLSPSLAVPKRAVMRGPQGAFVWVVGEGEKVRARPVRLGTTAGNLVVVLDGLAAGERVVVDGVVKMHPGALVKTVPVPLDAAAVDVAAGAPRTPDTHVTGV
jgi:membrane fusion protein, multidrug efflux system